MITPTDIQNKEFSKSFRGYNEEEVDMFLDLLTLDLEKLIAENINLKAMLKVAQEESGNEPEQAATVTATLESAKQLMDELATSSEKRAKALIHNAELDAALIIKDAQLQAEKIAQESYQLTRAYESFREEYKEMLKWQLEHFDDEARSLSYDRLQQLVEGNLDFNQEEESDEKTSEVEVPTKAMSDRETIIVTGIGEDQEDYDEEDGLDQDSEAMDEKKTLITDSDNDE